MNITIYDMLRIGLTGGIGSGKSTAADYFAARGVPVVDADEIGKELVNPGSPLVTTLAAALGRDIIRANGDLDRDRLRELVFADEFARQRLEAIMHPAILQEMVKRISNLHTPYCILAIPLLLETNQRNLVDRVLIIDTPVERQKERVRQRSQWSDTDIDAALAAQLKRPARIAAADDIIINDGDLATLEKQVEYFHQKYLALAAELSQH